MIDLLLFLSLIFRNLDETDDPYGLSFFDLGVASEAFFVGREDFLGVHQGVVTRVLEFVDLVFAL